MTKPDPRFLKLLLAIRAALIMAAQAIEEYCREDEKAETVTIRDTDTIAASNRLFGKDCQEHYQGK